MSSCKTIAIASAILFSSPQQADATAARPWMNTSLNAEERATLLVEVMNLTEKLMMMHGPIDLPIECPAKDGVYCNYTGDVHSNARLGIPQIKMNDGPQGFRMAGQYAHGGTSTKFPSSLTAGSTFDKELMYEWGQAISEEFYDKGANVHLGPGLCIARFPRGGRNFEYGSGEDPHLGYHFGYQTTRGIQSRGVMATAKHFVNNNQELGRRWVSENAEEQAQHEVYYPPFQGAIDAGTGAIMCSYNKQYGKYSCGNPEALKTNLKGRLGFKGFVMSDWWAGEESGLDLGLDMSMPIGGVFSPNGSVAQAIASGKMSESVVTESVHRILRSMFMMGIFDYENPHQRPDNATSAYHNDVARRVSAAASVLLTNKDSALPLDATDKSLTIAVIGAADTKTGLAIAGGGGSGYVQGSRFVAPLDALTARSAGKVTFSNGTDFSAAAEAAKGANVAVVFVGSNSHEGMDRANLSNTHPAKADDLVDAIVAAQPNTIVVASTPGAALMPWADKVKAVVANFMPGQEVGSAIADVLFGDVNPSGRLAVTIPNVENEMKWTGLQYPGLDADGNVNHTHPIYRNYTEGIFLGYRWYDQNSVAPAFPFGHGLSYTTFEYSGLDIVPSAAGSEKTFTVSATVKNSGKRAGSEVVQMYLGFPAGANQPPRVLRGFTKTSSLKPGASATVTFALNERDLSTWDVSVHDWVYYPKAHPTDAFTVYVGGSSRNTPLTKPFTP